jgi:hypothetical protein
LINKISSTREENSILYIDTQVFELNGSLDALEGKIDEYADDGMISFPEAQGLIVALTQVNRESEDIINVATALGITTENTNYQNALSILNTEILIWTTRPIYPAPISLGDRANIKNKFADVQDKKSKLINKIGSVRKDEAIAYSDVNLQAAKVYSDNHLITANTYSNTINNAIRNDLRLQAALPTSIKLDSNGITASTTDANKFARLDYRGLYVQNGAIQITSTDGTTVIDGEGVTASKIKAGDMFGVNLNIGSGNAVFKANSSGISLGNATFANAPFRVDMNGNMVASQANISGAINCTSLSINGSSILAGNKISGNYIDSITTGQITVTSQWGDNAIASAGNWNAKTTRLTPDGIYTGTLTANQINAIQGISLGANATIDWNYVNADPKIATAQGTANSASSAASTAQGTANGAFNTANIAQTMAQRILNGDPQAGTFINGNNIISPNITGATITGSLFKTALNGKRLEINSSGIKSYNSSNQLEGVVVDSGNFSSLDFYYQGTDRGGLAQVANVIQLLCKNSADISIGAMSTNPYGKITIQAGANAKTHMKGNVDFSEANVTGLNVVPVFG